ADPVFQGFGGACVDVLFVWHSGGRVTRKDAPLFDGNQIVRIGGVILVLHRGGDFVVRLRQHAIVRNFAGVVAIGGKRVNLSHFEEFSGDATLCAVTSAKLAAIDFGRHF